MNKQEPNGLFGLLDGMPAHGMVILGVLLALLAPLIPQCTSARLESAEAELERAKTLRDLDLREFKKQQDKQRQADSELPPEGSASAIEREEAREKALKEFEDQLDSDAGLASLERNIINARTKAAGVRSHLYVHWLGRVLLILGLLVMTVGAGGTRQKVLLVVLVLVLLGSLTGINLDVGAKAHLGS